MKQLDNFIQEKLKVTSKSKVNKVNLDDIASKIENEVYKSAIMLRSFVDNIGKIINYNDNVNFLINTGYSSFNCHGNINDIIDDINGLMPFAQIRKSPTECTTLFYGKQPITKGNYLPFLSSHDTFKFQSIEVLGKEIIINLKK